MDMSIVNQLLFAMALFRDLRRYYKGLRWLTFAINFFLEKNNRDIWLMFLRQEVFAKKYIPEIVFKIDSVNSMTYRTHIIYRTGLVFKRKGKKGNA